MPLRLTVTQRALAAGVAAAGLLIGAFAAGAAQGGDPAAAATASGRTLAVQPGTAAGADGASAAKITVTGTGAVSGTPDQRRRAGRRQRHPGGRGLADLNDTSSLLATARAKAAADARTKAAQYARALGMSLGPVVSVSEQHPAPVVPVFAAPSAGRATPSPVPVSPGSQQVTVTVTAVFALG